MKSVFVFVVVAVFVLMVDGQPEQDIGEHCSLAWFKKCFLLVADRPRQEPACNAIGDFFTCFDNCDVRRMAIDADRVHDGPTTYLNVYDNDCSQDYVNIEHLRNMTAAWRQLCR